MANTLIGRQIGNYNITKQLGEGGMGAVYLGEHPLIGKKVAVKVLHEDLAGKQEIVQRFFQEAKSVNDIHHENIVDIVDFGKMKDDSGRDVVYFLMEFLEGESLASRLKGGQRSPEEAVHIIEQCASALAASHGKSIVHRDIKPDNIFLISRGHDPHFVKLLDFGIAKLTGGGSSSMTRTGSVIGTPAYMSPEQCDGRGNIDWRSDIYSLGVVLYEMLAGRVPFVGDGFGEILVAHLTTQPPLPTQFNPNIPPQLEAITMRCLEKSRDARFQSMDELREALLNSGAYVPPRPLTSANRVLENASAETMVGAAARPTTLSGAAGEVRQTGSGTGGGVAPSRSKTPIFLAFAGLAVAGGVVAFVVLKKPEVKPTSPIVAPHIEEKPKDEQIHVLIDSTPAGAVITRAGVAQPIGKTPKELTVKKDEAEFDVLLSLDGYKSETRTVRTRHDNDMLIALAKLPPPVEPVVPTAVKPVKPSHHSSSHHDTGEAMQPLPDKKPLKPDTRPSVDPDGVLAPKL